jgi:phage gpG-like protein
MNLSVEIRGTKLLQKEIREKGDEIKKAVKTAVDLTAYAVETSAKKKLKSDGHIITGRLWSSIHPELKEGDAYNYTDNNGKSHDGSLGEQIADDEAIVGTNVEYGPYIEYGTKYIRADSFLGFAAVEQRKKLVARVKKEIEKALGK